MKFILEKPKNTSQDPSILEKELLSAFFSEQKGEVLEFSRRASEQRYLYWDKVRFIQPVPQGISRETLWSIIKLFRIQKSITTRIIDKENKPFWWYKPHYFDRILHQIDLRAGGDLVIGNAEGQRLHKQKMISRGILEEAIASSQLEGATTSRRVAKQIIQENRVPRNDSERMILNSYFSLKAVEEEYKNRAMDMDLLVELHALITKDTKDAEGETPKLRKAGESVAVTDRENGKIYHEAPDVVFVQQELEKFFVFANTDAEEDFLHPVIKAIMLHFWIGYLHPFTDGNGRFARIIFYWYLLRKGYWAFAYLPISKIIKKSPQQYTMAYVYTEQDEGDLTYFIDYNLRKIELAMEEFQKYFEEQVEKNKYLSKDMERKYKLNLRQVQLLQHLHGNMSEYTTLSVHMHIYQVTKVTALGDLKDLTQKGLLRRERRGKYVYYYATESVEDI